MNQKFRRYTRNFHLLIDSYVGQIFSRQSTLKKISRSPHTPLTPDNFSNFRYSKREHFQYFRVFPLYKNISPAICDLKVYQDELVYTFILDNLPPGSRLLEIGGGESRIINELKNHYEIWNLDKLQGSGFGPKQLINTGGFYLVQDYIGNFSTLLTESYFDMVFSISTIEHLPDDNKLIDKSIKDIHRLLKPGAYSLHCIDALLFDDRYFVHPFVSKVFESELIHFDEVSFEEIEMKNDIWLLPTYAFYTRWFHLVKKPMRTFGHPFSINILWQTPKSI